MTASKGCLTVNRFLYSAVVWLRRFFLAVGAAMAACLTVCLVAGLPKEIIYLSMHGLLLCGLGYLINDRALAGSKHDNSLRPGQEDQDA